ncbi:MAG: hypothetical protein IT340_02055 [Chloroflexi bacterium]|nr:hypothetical protein [Chloroflexota bacterium]
MRQHAWIRRQAASVVIVGCLWAAAPVGAETKPLGDGAAGLGGLDLPALPGVTATLTKAPAEGGETLQLKFSKPTPERRLVAWQAKVAGNFAFARSLDLRVRLTGVPTEAARLATVLFQRDGGVHYKIAAGALTAGDWQALRLSLTNPREAAFSQDASGRLEWDGLERVWLGVVIDGPANGTLELSRAVWTSELPAAAAPVTIPLGQPADWNLGHDPAVIAKSSLVNEGPNGEPVMRFDFTFPQGSHMWLVPGLTLKLNDVEGYRALRYTYKTQLPKGPNLLFGIAEAAGGQYVIDPPLAPSETWKTHEQPLAGLKLGAWSKDADGAFSLEPGVALQCGLHGTANPGGPGVIWIAKLELLP